MDYLLLNVLHKAFLHDVLEDLGHTLLHILTWLGIIIGIIIALVVLVVFLNERKSKIAQQKLTIVKQEQEKKNQKLEQTNKNYYRNHLHLIYNHESTEVLLKAKETLKTIEFYDQFDLVFDTEKRKMKGEAIDELRALLKWPVWYYIDCINQESRRNLPYYPVIDIIYINQLIKQRQNKAQ